jgi:hypothetical protein
LGMHRWLDEQSADVVQALDPHSLLETQTDPPSVVSRHAHPGNPTQVNLTVHDDVEPQLSWVGKAVVGGSVGAVLGAVVHVVPLLLLPFPG